MAAPKALTAEVRRLLGKLAARDGGVSASELLDTLSGHDAVVRMLARAHAAGDEDRVRRALHDLSELLALLQEQMEREIGKSPTKSADGWEGESAGDSAVETGNGSTAKAATKSGVKSASQSAPKAPPRSRAKAIAPPKNDFTNLADYDQVKVFIDGAAKGNPGEASVGIVIMSLEGETICEEARAIGEATNNVAEYTALIDALKILVRHGRPPKAYFFSDSELLVNQINGSWKIRNPGLMPLVGEAQALRRRLPRFQITHLEREKNKRADELANFAIQRSRAAAAG